MCAALKKASVRFSGCLCVCFPRRGFSPLLTFTSVDGVLQLFRRIQSISLANQVNSVDSIESLHLFSVLFRVAFFANRFRSFVVLRVN